MSRYFCTVLIDIIQEGRNFSECADFRTLHLNFNQMPYAVYLGIVFALMVEATGSIYTSMLMHFC